MAVCLEICEACSGKRLSLWSSRCHSWAAHPSRIGVHPSLRLPPFTLLAEIVQNKAQEWGWCQVIGQMADREGEFKATTCRLNFLCSGKHLSHRCGSHPTKKWAGAFDSCCLLVWLFSHCLWLCIFSTVSWSVDTFLSKLSWPQQLDMSENTAWFIRDNFSYFKQAAFVFYIHLLSVEQAQCLKCSEYAHEPWRHRSGQWDSRVLLHLEALNMPNSSGEKVNCQEQRWNI